MTLATPEASQMGLPCPHRWLLGAPGLAVAATCAYCGDERSFMGSWDEERQQAKRYGRNYQTLRGAAKKSNAQRLSSAPS